MKNSLRSIAVMGMVFLLSCTLNVSYAGSPPVSDSSPKIELTDVSHNVIADVITIKASLKAIQVNRIVYLVSWYSSKVLRFNDLNVGNTNKGYAGLPDRYGERIKSYNCNILRC